MGLRVCPTLIRHKRPGYRASDRHEPTIPQASQPGAAIRAMRAVSYAACGLYAVPHTLRPCARTREGRCVSGAALQKGHVLYMSPLLGSHSPLAWCGSLLRKTTEKGGAASITPSATWATRHDANILERRLPLVLWSAARDGRVDARDMLGRKIPVARHPGVCARSQRLCNLCYTRHTAQQSVCDVPSSREHGSSEEI